MPNKNGLNEVHDKASFSRSPWKRRRERFPNDLVLTTSDLGKIHRAGEIHLHVSQKAFPSVMRMLYGLSVFDFKRLSDLTGVDYPSRQPRFDVVYQLVSIRYGIRCRVKVSVEDGESRPSRTGRYASANWAERECYDMFGISFEGHPDLRRLLTDYGFEGHPLRKDFPLTGFTEVRYDEASKRVVNEPVERSQDIRMQEPVMSWKQLPDNQRSKGGRGGRKSRT